MNYAATLLPKFSFWAPLLLKPLMYLHGESRIIWEEDELLHMKINEDLEYVVAGKFSYGWPNIQEVRKIIPKKYELKGEVNIGLLCNRYVLIKASRIEDYVNLLSIPIFYIAHRN